MTPTPGDRLQRFVGDQVRFTLEDAAGGKPAAGWRAMLRTNLGRAELLRREILQAHTRSLPIAGGSWRDLAMQPSDAGWVLDLSLGEVGFFKAKAYLVDPRGWQHWPAGPDVGVSVHPDAYRTANLVYVAFARMFGASRTARSSTNPAAEERLVPLDRAGYTVIPPSGTLRDLQRQLPHIIHTLGCRILHLLPVNPTPTTYARFGRFGSPYAALDLVAIDPALVVFDKRSTGIEQFCDLTTAVHALGARVVLDIVINHTGWGSVLQENHPEWFLREPNGTFVSPGAWGTTWEDLVELKHQNVALWDELAEVFLTWCRRGVDGFRCDAGYKVPVPAWQYIVARVQQEFPETLFLLEGLGGAWEATEALLTEGGMQWAYSELFQNYSGSEVRSYLDHSFRQSRRVGLLVHYSETHDNDRLAAKGRAWSLLRNRLCALTSVGGGFGFTCGVEWLATEKIRVHGSTGMAWDNPDNIVPELARLNRLLAEHPCFFEGASVTRVSPPDAPVYALLRRSEEGLDTVLVLVNLQVERANDFQWDRAALAMDPPLSSWVDLLGQHAPTFGASSVRLTLPPGAAYCLAPLELPRGLCGNVYRESRARAAFAMNALTRLLSAGSVGPLDWRSLSHAVERSPAGFLARVSEAAAQANARAADVLTAEAPGRTFPRVVTWTVLDARRVTLVPPAHWLLIEDSVRFRATLESRGAAGPEHTEAIRAGGKYVACFPPRENGSGDATLLLERYEGRTHQVQGLIRFLPVRPQVLQGPYSETDLILLTNGRGGMARLGVDLGRISSKYDCVLGANLHPTLPVDRHVLVKRIRVWVNADGFISPLDFRSTVHVEPGPPARWNFVANAGDGRSVQIDMQAEMVGGRNTTVFKFRRPSAAQASGKQLPAEAEVRLTVRCDIEDRNFHWETHRNGGAEHHFSTHIQNLADTGLFSGAQQKRRKHPDNPEFTGFLFGPAADRQLRVFADTGCYHPQPEWSENIPHPVEQSRGQVPGGDAFSPGWFELPLPKGSCATLVVTAEPALTPEDTGMSGKGLQHSGAKPPPDHDPLGRWLERAIQAFVVRRGEGKTVIAGYPWFLDWGRDTFICARGLLAAGMAQEVKDLLVTFGKFERQGTLPNTIFGEDASNRDTSDAPLWYGLVAEELAALSAKTGAEVLCTTRVDGKRSLADILESIAQHYVSGTPNGIRMDPASGLIWSPSHFTWMDTNYPAGTPREGYPIEIQALWVRFLRQLGSLAPPASRSRWNELAQQAGESLEKLFWCEERGYYADVLRAGRGQPASEGQVDDALRSNELLVVSLGLAPVDRARCCVEAARKYLVVPGALRSLAPLPVSLPLPVYGNDGRLLNHPNEPYWGHYEGDEDTRRKPAYHNGTAWTWTFPTFCEALVRAWEFSPESVAAARAYLGSTARLLSEGCLGQLPEVLDGDSPHVQRGCDAQSWAATEALRVWKLLQG